MNRYRVLNINNKTVGEHRVIMERFLNRKLRSDEVVHHLNYIKSDNRIENLQVMSQKEHHSLKHHFIKEEKTKIIPKYMKTKEVAKRLNISMQSLTKILREGKMLHYKIDRNYLISESHLKKYLEEREAK